MAIDKVREYLKRFNKDEDILEFSVSSATVKDAALAIGCDEAHIAKTMSFIVSEQPILIVVAGDKKVNPKSVLILMSAGIKKGTTIDIICEGENEEADLKTMLDAIAGGLGEGTE